MTTGDYVPTAIWTAAEPYKNILTQNYTAHENVPETGTSFANEFPVLHSNETGIDHPVPDSSSMPCAVLEAELLEQVLLIYILLIIGNSIDVIIIDSPINIITIDSPINIITIDSLIDIITIDLSTNVITIDLSINSIITIDLSIT